MKARLPSAPATDEDSRIWWRRYVSMARGRMGGMERVRLDLERATIACDRRDASLMFLQRMLASRLKPWANFVRWIDLQP